MSITQRARIQSPEAMTLAQQKVQFRANSCIFFPLPLHQQIKCASVICSHEVYSCQMKPLNEKSLISIPCQRRRTEFQIKIKRADEDKANRPEVHRQET